MAGTQAQDELRRPTFCVPSQALRLDPKADRPFRDPLQEASAPLLATDAGGEEPSEQSAQTAGEPTGLKEPAAQIPKLVNLLETGARTMSGE